MAVQVKKKVNNETTYVEKKNEDKVIEKEKINNNLLNDNKLKELNETKMLLESKVEKQQKEFEEKLNQMQTQMNLLLEIIKTKDTNEMAQKFIPDDEEIAVGCRMFAGLGMVNSDGTQTIVFRCGEKKYIPYEDLKSYLKENSRNNKALFANGLLFFYDEDNYKRFKIKKMVDLREENIIEILTTPDTNQMIGKINLLTNNLRKESVLHTLKYMIADMLIREPSKLKNFTYDNRDTLEKYFGVKFDTLIANANMYRFIKGEK